MVGVGDLLFPLMLIFNPGNAVALHDQPQYLRPDFNREIVVRECRTQISVGCAAPPPVPYRQLHTGKPLLLRAVVVIRPGISCVCAGSLHGLDQGVRVFRSDYCERPATAAIGARPPLPVLLFTKVRKHLRVRPVRKPGPRPPVIVPRMTAHIPHSIRGGASAHDLASSAFDYAVVQTCLRGSGETPVMQFLRIHPAPTQGDRDQWVTVPAASF